TVVDPALRVTCKGAETKKRHLKRGASGEFY
ncbi:MAG: hypothetical protein ACI91J_000879, partial [Yoonia sp.]